MKCPLCHKENILEGRIFNQPDYVNPKSYFRPDGFPFFACIGNNVWMENHFFACLFCGFVWSTLNAEQLMRIATKYNIYRQEKGLESDAENVYELGKE
jgi:hypothetical protein